MAESRGLILNVDDYEASRYARSQMLQRSGFRVLEAGTGAEALRLASDVATPTSCSSTSTCRTWTASRCAADCGRSRSR